MFDPIEELGEEQRKQLDNMTRVEEMQRAIQKEFIDPGTSEEHWFNA